MSGAEFAGTWVGLAGPAGTSERRFVRLRVGAEDGGEVSAVADVPAEGQFRIPATVDESGAVTFELNGASVALELDGSGFMREVALSDSDSARIRGTYSAADGASVLVTRRGVDGDSIPFAFRPDGRGGFEAVRWYATAPDRFLTENAHTVKVVDAAAQRPSLAIEGDGATAVLRPADLYDEEPFAWNSGEVRLAGTLLLPKGNGRVPAVVLMHGTQPGTRDFYRIFAHGFVRVGMAALVFDKRGFGESGGSADSSWRDRATDAAEAVRALRAHRRIAPERIGLWAFSNGTWSAPMVSGGIEPVRFVVLTGAAGVSPAGAEIHRKLQELREWKIPNETLERVRRAWELAYACVVGNVVPNWETEYDGLIAGLHADTALTSIPLADYGVKQPWLAPVPPPFTAAQLTQMAFGQMPEMGIDPCDYLEKTAAPVLFVIGEDDTNTPGREGAARVREALDRAGNPHSRVELIPNAGHFLNVTVPISGMSAAEAAGELHCLRFVPGYFEVVTEWVREQAFGD